LRVLNLDGNRIQRLPESLSGLRKLELLSLHDNPLEPGEAARIRGLLPWVELAVDSDDQISR